MKNRASLMFTITRKNYERKHSIFERYARDRAQAKAIQGLVKKYRGVGRSREGVGHQFLSLSQGVGRSIFSDPGGGGVILFHVTVYTQLLYQCAIYFCSSKNIYTNLK